MTTSKLFSISLLTWFVGVIVIAFFSTGAAMIFTIGGLIPVCLVVELVGWAAGYLHFRVRTIGKTALAYGTFGITCRRDFLGARVCIKLHSFALITEIY